MAGNLKKNLSPGMKGDKESNIGFLDIFSDIAHNKFHINMVSYLGGFLISGLGECVEYLFFYHYFLKNPLLKVSDFLHDGRRQ